MDKANFDESIAKKMLNKCRAELDLESYQHKVIKNKIIVIIGGQPGAGKSSITKLIEHIYDKNIITINGDDFKPFYPNYRQILQANPTKTADVVQPYSNYLVDNLKQELINKQINAMIEGTMRTSKVPISTAAQFKNAGYKVEAHIVAVNYYASRVGCIERFENDLALTGAGRTVNTQLHDEAYNQIPNTIKVLIDSKQFDNIIIYNRNGKILANLANQEDIVKIYTEYRNKITPELYKDILQHINNTVNLKLLRKASSSEINDLTMIKQALCQEFSKQQIVEVDKQIYEMIKTKNIISVDIIQKIAAIIDTVHEIKAVVLPDGNVVLNQLAKVAIADFIALEETRNDIVTNWGKQSNREIKSELGAKANILLGEIQKSAELNKAKLTEALSTNLSFKEQSEFREQADNLQKIYERLTHKSSNVISITDYKQVVYQMNTRSQSNKLVQSLKMSKSLRL